MKIPFAPPFVDDDVIKEVEDTLRSGWITTGPKTYELESEITNLCKCDQTLCVNSWTSGAILVLKWLGLKEGDEVIVPAYTYAASALSVIHAGGTPVIVDVLEDFTIDPKAVAQAITPRTKAIMGVDVGGLMADYDALFDIVNSEENVSIFSAENEKQKKFGRIMILADSAHSIGARYKDRCSGTCADISILSLHAVKNITTGEGGAICLTLPDAFDAKAEYDLMRMWALNGQTKDALTKTKDNGWRYDILFEGIKVNMPDICAAIGLAQIRKYDLYLLRERARIANRYANFFNTKSWAQTPFIVDDKRISCNHLYALRIKNVTEAQRDQMIDAISATNASVNVHFIPLPMLTAFKNRGYKIEDFPVAYDNFSREISLPIYPQLTNEQIDYICNVVEEAYFSVASREKTA